MDSRPASPEELASFGVGVDFATGVFAALHSGPQLVHPSVWLPAVLGDGEPFANTAQANRVVGALMLLYNGVSEMLTQDDESLCPDPEEVGEVADFCAGYLIGMRLQPKWSEDEVGLVLALPFGALAGELPDEDLLGLDENPLPDPEAWKQDHRERLMEHVMALYDYWAPARETASQPVVVQRRVGRNDPCPCGSGKKYKKCCALAERTDFSEPEIVHSPLERKIEQDGISVAIEIYRGAADEAWILEVVDHLGGSTVWDDPFPTDQAALDAALQAIEEDGIDSFAEETEAEQ